MKYMLFAFSGVLLTAAPALAVDKPSPQAIEFFEKNVRPVLVEQCFKCHGAKRQEADLRLDSRAAMLEGTKKIGPVLVPGQAEKSKLIKAIGYDDDIVMPPTAKLKAEAIEALTAWVQMGAPWPDGEVAPKPLTVAEVRAKHWSFQPVKTPVVPAVKNTAWVQTPIDAFVLANLEKQKVTPAPIADKRTLIRRAYFDLLGLPPAPEDVEAFVKDESPEAWAKVIDKLLASPHYGERWGRHWLDVARYADTKGYVFTEERRFPYSYTYRDYVIKAFNDDLPYDQFVLQQLAADRLPLGEDKHPLAALGFLTLGRRFLNNNQDIIDDRIDVTMRGLQGMTVACARCHDHKFDPIPTKDYYSLYGVFASSVEPKELPSLGASPDSPTYRAFAAELQKREDAVKKYREDNKEELAKKNRKFQDELKGLEKKVEEWKVTGPGSPPRAMALEDSPNPVNPVVFKRGNPNMRGDAVPRHYLEVLAGEQRKPFGKGSGRLELAQAIASKDNPLTARVLVNRLWGWHFGAGLVRTPSDFGMRGEAPTHPELLDWLASRFMEDGWSIKKLHRVILLSNTYRQSSDVDEKRMNADPENRLLARMNRQRLDFESLRDALLATAGHLDETMGGPAVEITKAPYGTRRTVYGFVDRQNLPGVFRTFDFASPDATVPQRFQTTVPQQALFLMNSPFAIEQAKAFANRPDVVKFTKLEERVERMIRLAYGRAPEAAEMELAKKFLTTPATASKLTPWEEYAQVLLLANEFAFVD